MFGRMLRIFLARFYRRGNLHRRKTWHDPLVRACRRQVNTTLAADATH
jgi:hypothetical protein